MEQLEILRQHFIHMAEMNNSFSAEAGSKTVRDFLQGKASAFEECAKFIAEVMSINSLDQAALNQKGE